MEDTWGFIANREWEHNFTLHYRCIQHVCTGKNQLSKTHTPHLNPGEYSRMADRHPNHIPVSSTMAPHNYSMPDSFQNLNYMKVRPDRISAEVSIRAWASLAIGCTETSRHRS
jgi:hypothetical protein